MVRMLCRRLEVSKQRLHEERQLEPFPCIPDEALGRLTSAGTGRTDVIVSGHGPSVHGLRFYSHVISVPHAF
jgi:hypothetical protein